MFRGLGIPAVALVFALSAVAQYPAPSDPPQSGPPSGYPPGGYPPGTIPREPTTAGESKLPAHESKKKAKKRDQDQMTKISAEGHTLSNDGKQLVIHIDDGRVWTMSINTDTKWTRAGSVIDPSKIIPRTVVRAEAAEDEDYNLIATQIELVKDAPPPPPPVAASASSGNRAAASEDEDAELTRPTILHPPDAPDRPVIKRGKPAQQASSKDDDDAPAPAAKSATHKVTPVAAAKDIDFTIDSASPAVPKHSFGSELLDQTTDWLANFNHGLPNYTCEQQTTRYIQQSRSEDWRAQDVISAKVINEDGNDRYEDLMLDGKKTNKSLEQLGGQTSTGEFGGMLASLFQPIRNTDFQFQRAATLEDTDVVIYTFKVPLANSDWQIRLGGQTLYPAYSGKIWVNKKTAQIMRFEQQADNIPKDFPLDTVETAVDYMDVPIETFHFWLPSHAENLSCQRGTAFCAKNVMEFRDYHKYAGESTIVFH